VPALRRTSRNTAAQAKLEKGRQSMTAGTAEDHTRRSKTSQLQRDNPAVDEKPWRRGPDRRCQSSQAVACAVTTILPLRADTVAADRANQIIVRRGLGTQASVVLCLRRNDPADTPGVAPIAAVGTYHFGPDEFTLFATATV